MYGPVKIGRFRADGGYTEELLDFEQTWWDGKMLVLKTYDSTGAVIQISLGAEMLMEELLGFAAQVEVVKSVTELPPRKEGTDGD